MRRYGVLLLLAIVALIAALKSQPSPPALALIPETATPTIGVLLPIVQKPGLSFLPVSGKQATYTPTPTNTPTATYTPSITPTQLRCSGRFDGSISLKDNKPTYATYIEWIKFLQWVHNNNNSTTCFGILGFNAIKPDGSAYPFNSQWSASGVPSKYLTIYANCWGPNGQPCAGSQSSGQQEDHMGSGNYVVAETGVYTVYYMVCYSDYNACQKAGGNWAQLGVIQFTAVNWTPSAPSGTQAAPTPQAPTGPECYLITDDPRGIYLNCNVSHLKERLLFQH